MRFLYKTRRRWRPALLGLAVLAIGLGAAATPAVRRNGLASLFPTTILIPALPGESFGNAFSNELLRRISRAEDGRLRSAQSLWSWQRRWLTHRAAAMLGDQRSAALGARLLYEIGPDGSAAGAALGRTLKSGPVEARRWAVMAIQSVDAPPEIAVPPLAEALLADSDPLVREFAANGLVYYSDRSADALEASRKALLDPEPKVRLWAAAGLLELRIDVEQAVTALVSLLDGSAQQPRLWAIDALERAGTAAHPALPALMRISASDSDQAVKAAALKAVRSLQRASADGVTPDTASPPPK